jgi:hypothetical protein
MEKAQLGFLSELLEFQLHKYPFLRDLCFATLCRFSPHDPDLGPGAGEKRQACYTDASSSCLLFELGHLYLTTVTVKTNLNLASVIFSSSLSNLTIDSFVTRDFRLKAAVVECMKFKVANSLLGILESETTRRRMYSVSVTTRRRVRLAEQVKTNNGCHLT